MGSGEPAAGGAIESVWAPGRPPVAAVLPASLEQTECTSKMAVSTLSCRLHLHSSDHIGNTAETDSVPLFVSGESDPELGLAPEF